MIYGNGQHSPIWASIFRIDKHLTVGSRVFLEKSAGGTTWMEGNATRTIRGAERHGVLLGVNDTELMFIDKQKVLWFNGRVEMNVQW